jgi:hypothetical protein
MRARGAAWVVGAVAAARVHPVVRVRGATARPPPAPAAAGAAGVSELSRCRLCVGSRERRSTEGICNCME